MNAKRKIVLMILAVFSMIFAVSGLTACGGITLETPTNIKYDGEYITWDAVEDATGYVVQVGESGAELTYLSPMAPYGANGQEFTVKVKATAGTGKKKVESEPISMTFRPLPTIEDIVVSETGVVSWTANGSCQYLIKDNGVVLPNSIGIAKIETHSVGEHRYQVRPVMPNDNSYYSYWSEAVDVNQLGKVSAESILYSEEYIMFEPISGAEKYKIFIDGKEEAEITTKKYLYNADNQDFQVAIQAIGNHTDSFDGAKSEVKKFKFLPMVTGLKVEGGALSWDEVLGATGYEVKVKKGDITQTYNIKEPFFDNKTALTTATSLEISVRATASSDVTYFSKFTDAKPVYILPAPVITWDGYTSLDGGENSIKWNMIGSATGYMVKVVDPDGVSQSYQYGENQQNYANNYEKVGEYLVTVSAIANEQTNSNVYSSMPSNVIRVKRPSPAEKVANGQFITSQESDNSNGFTVTCQNDSGYSFRILKNGLKFTNDSDKPQITVNYSEFFEDIGDNGVALNFAIKKMGKGATYNGSDINVFLNSKEEDNLSFTITVLSTPKNVVMDGYNVKYDEVPNANGYAISTSSNSNPMKNGTLTMDLGNALQVGGYEVMVAARGNGRDVLASNYSAPIRVVRLDAPTNLKILTDVDGGKLQFTAPQLGNASGYELLLNNKVEQSNVIVISNMNKLISTAGTDVSLVAISNSYDDGVYYMTSLPSTSKRFVKLNAPSNLSFNNTHLMWNLTGINESELGKITYRVFNDKNDAQISREGSLKNFDLSANRDFEGGRTYTFTVQAIGDGETYVNSEISQSATVTKLATPDVKKVNGKYTWKGVANTSTYAVTIDGVVVNRQTHTGLGDYSFDPNAFLTELRSETKGYNVEVVAVGNSAVGDFPTIDSFPYQINQATMQLQTPEFKVEYSKTAYAVDGEIIVTVTKESPFAKGYKYTVGGKTQPDSENIGTTYRLNPNGPGTFEIEVYAVGGTFDDDGNYTLNSQSKGIKRITLLSSVNQDQIIFNQNDWNLTWRTVDNAIKYKVEIYLDGASEPSKVLENVTETDVSLAEYYGEISTLKVVITAVGNGTNIITGESAEKEWVNL